MWDASSPGLGGSLPVLPGAGGEVLAERSLRSSCWRGRGCPSWGQQIPAGSKVPTVLQLLLGKYISQSAKHNCFKWWKTAEWTARREWQELGKVLQAPEHGFPAAPGEGQQGAVERGWSSTGELWELSHTDHSPCPDPLCCPGLGKRKWRWKWRS